MVTGLTARRSFLRFAPAANTMRWLWAAKTCDLGCRPELVAVAMKRTAKGALTRSGGVEPVDVPHQLGEMGQRQAGAVKRVRVSYLVRRDQPGRTGTRRLFFDFLGGLIEIGKFDMPLVLHAHVDQQTLGCGEIDGFNLMSHFEDSARKAVCRGGIRSLVPINNGEQARGGDAVDHVAAFVSSARRIGLSPQGTHTQTALRRPRAIVNTVWSPQNSHFFGVLSSWEITRTPIP